MTLTYEPQSPAPPPAGSQALQEAVLKGGYLPSELRPHVAAMPPADFGLLRFPLGDIDNFSVCRHAYAEGRRRFYGMGDALRRYAPWETRYLAAVEELRSKALGESVSLQDGGALAPEVWSTQWFDLLRAFSAIEQLPIIRLGVPFRTLHLPKVSVDIAVSAVVENNPIPASQFAFGQISYTARKSAQTLAVSNELMRDAPFLADQLLRRSTAGALAYSRDVDILTGTGGPQPTGLITMASAGTIAKYYVPGSSTTASLSSSPNHGIPSFLHISQLRGKIHVLNGSTNAPATGQAHCNGMIAHSRFEQTVQVQAGAGGAGPWTDNNGRPLWMTGLTGPVEATDENRAAVGSLLGQIWVLTNILPITSTDGGGTVSSYIIAGWWNQFALFESQQVAYDVTMDGSYFANDQTGVKVTHRWDAGPIHPEAFAVLAGVDP